MAGNELQPHAEWLKKANDDETAGQDLVAAGHIASAACFHFQQAAEKQLKGLLVFHNKTFPKVHDLLHLETLLLKVEPEIRELENDLDLLNGYYIETRYPGDYPEFTLDEAKRAFEAAKRIGKFVFEKVSPRR